MTDHQRDEFDPWQFRARPDPLSRHEVGVVDGDTYDVMVDNGFHQRTSVRIRSSSVSSREIFGVPKESKEYERGIAHKNAAIEWIESVTADADSDWALIVQTTDTAGKYGRWIGDLYDPDTGESLGDHLLDEFDDLKPNTH